MGRLADLQDTVGKAKCDRCGFWFLVEELLEEEETGLIVDSKCLDHRSFNETKSDSSKDTYNHHFTT